MLSPMNLPSILAFVDQLSQLDTEGVSVAPEADHAVVRAERDRPLSAQTGRH